VYAALENSLKGHEIEWYESDFLRDFYQSGALLCFLGCGGAEGAAATPCNLLFERAMEKQPDPLQKGMCSLL